MRVVISLMSVVLAVGACAHEPSAPDPVETRRPITFSQLLAVPRQSADHRIAYGADPLQFGELWLPSTRRGYPVVILIHGGCWRADLPGVELMDYMAADLRGRGYAVWNIEYRRIGHPGGGYPGTFHDVAAALDHLRVLAPVHGLDLRRVAVSGHSAGGHLALWAAARDRIPSASPLHSSQPLPVRGVVSLAGIADLAAYRETGPDACGGPSTIDGLVGLPGTDGRDVYADTSPPALSPLGDRQIVISGALDPIVPPRFGQAYAETAAARGDPATSVVLAGAGHFELIDPTSASWPRVVRAYDDLLK
ncbi:MAG TPA: alpha/beta hydrolase [Brevundimonas sp.]|nr:alpha/beta hydrolase [Brevundimonas sp.]